MTHTGRHCWGKEGEEKLRANHRHFCRDTMTNERARARALCMNEYDRNIVSLLSKLFMASVHMLILRK